MQYMKRVILAIFLVVVMFIMSVNSTNALDEIGHSAVISEFNNVASDLVTGETMAENGKYILSVDSRNGNFTLLDKETGYVYYSNPPDHDNDPIAKNKQKIEIASQLIIKYVTDFDGIESTAVSSQEVEHLKIEKRPHGFRAIYVFESLGIHIPVEYRINEDSFEVEVLTSQIDEVKGNYITEISLLPYFGASGPNHEGYLFVPDGCGALINFNNGKTGRNIYYTQVIYGRDKTYLQTKKEPYGENARLPVFGLKSENNGLFAVIEKGDAIASVNAMVGGVVHSYNTVYPSFRVRYMDQYTLGSSASAVVNYIYQQNRLDNISIKVRYYTLKDEDASYSGMARLYKNYLIKNMNLKKQYRPRSMFLELIGAVEVNKSIMGIPLNTIETLTTYKQAVSIIKQLKAEGVHDIVFSYRNWNRDNVRLKTPVDVTHLNALGNKKDFEFLLEYAKQENINTFLDVDLLYFEKSRWGISVNKDSAKLISKLPAIQKQFKYSTNLEDKKSPWGYLSGLELLERVVPKFASSFSQLETGLGLYSMGEYVYSDFTEPNSTRLDTVETYINSMELFESELMTSGGNAYMIGYSNYVCNTPSVCSGYDIIDETVPFYQLALDGLVSMSLEPVNRSSDPHKLLLKTIETGTSIQFSWFFNDPYILKNTRYNHLYGSDYHAWLMDALAYYKEVIRVADIIGESYILSHRKLAPEVYETKYENGKSVVVNYSGIDYEDIHGVVKANDYCIR
jgi:hypothetical protein